MEPSSRIWAQQPLITQTEIDTDPEENWETQSQSTVFAQHYTRHMPSSSSGLGTPLTLSRDASTEGSNSKLSSSQYTKCYIFKLLVGSLVLFSALGGLGFLLLLSVRERFSSSVNVKGHQEATFSLLWGSAVSFFSCLAVIIDFRLNISSRRHPAPIIYWRTVSDFCSATIFIVANVRGLIWPRTSINCNAGNGLFLAATVEFLALASEGWFCVLIADLVTSLTNPFADYRHNMKTYHIAVWTLASCAFIGMLICDCAGEITQSMCWLRSLHSETWTRNKCLWGFYLGWIMIFYGYGVVRIIHAKCYLIGKGTGAIEETRSARRLVVDGTMSSLTLYMAYVVLLGVAGAILAPEKFNATSTSTQETWSKHAMGYAYAARGLMDAAVWVGFKRQTSHAGGTGSKLLGERASNDSSFSDLGEVTVEELDLDLSPQLNPVLRSEIVANVTSGIRRSVERHLVSVAAVRAQQHPNSSSSSFVAGPSLWAEVVDLTLISGVRFQDHHPASFALIRKSCGLGDMEYVSQVERITAEKLSEGKSGAFMFFSKNGRFIIKTLEKSEADTLHGMLHRYADYLDTHKGSLLSKYLGSHTLHMYGQVFHFIVMLNVFRDAQKINARYDIKGSWVNRSATPATPGSRARCRHCSAPFIVGRDDPCRGRTGHEADVVLKDNDFKTKVSLKPEQAIALISRLEDDSNFLSSEGIMDYSLLIGVHDIQFTVNPHATLKKQAVKRRESLRLSYASHTPSQAGRRQSAASVDLSYQTRVTRQESNASSTLEAAQYARSQNNMASSHHSTSHHGIEEEDEFGNPSIISEAGEETKVETSPTLNQTNISMLSRVDPHIPPSQTEDPSLWNFEETESSIASEASTIVDLLPSAVTDFSPEYTGFMQPDQQSAHSEAGRSHNPRGEEDEMEEDFVMDESESLLLAQLRDPTSPIFQSRVVVGPGLFYVGIIDTLQTWSMKKRIERMWKKWLRPQDEHGLSCTAPGPYSERFKLKIRDIVEHDFIRQLPSI